MKSISRVNLFLAVMNVCLGTAILVLSAVSTFKFSKKKIDKI